MLVIMKHMYRRGPWRNLKEGKGRTIQSFTLKELKGQDEPGPGDERDVEEADEVAKEAGDQHLQIFQTQDPQHPETRFTLTWPYLVMNLKL